MIDLSTSPVPNAAFSFAALSSRSVAIALISLPRSFILSLRSLGIIDDKVGKIGAKRKLSMVLKEGLTDPKESKAVKTGGLLPLRHPKSCEKPPFPMESSLV